MSGSQGGEIPGGCDPGAGAGWATLVVHLERRSTTPWLLRTRSAAGRGERIAAGTLRLEVDDLRGRRLAVADIASEQTRLELPSGTCVVTAIESGRRRSYTLTLEAGASFDLHVRPGAR